jgi:hypothetical protein
MEIKFTSEPGQRYQLLSRSSFEVGAWEPVAESVPTSVQTILSDGIKDLPHLCYQVRVISE